MSLGIILALLASFGWGAGDVFSRKAMYHVSPAAVALGMAILIALTLAVAVALTDGLGAVLSLPWWVLVLAVVMGLLAYVGGQFLYLEGMQRAGLTLVAPVIAGAPFFSVLMAVAFGGERPSLLTILGGLIIIAGVILVVTDRDRVVRS